MVLDRLDERLVVDNNSPSDATICRGLTHRRARACYLKAFSNWRPIHAAPAPRKAVAARHRGRYKRVVLLGNTLFFLAYPSLNFAALDAHCRILLRGLWTTLLPFTRWDCGWAGEPSPSLLNCAITSFSSYALSWFSVPFRAVTYFEHSVVSYRCTVVVLPLRALPPHALPPVLQFLDYHSNTILI